MKGYCSVVNIEKYLLTEIDSVFETNVIGWIEAMETFIDKETGRSFIADDEESARYFDGDSSNLFYIDEFTEITELKFYDTDGTLLYALVEDTDYFVQPYNVFPKRRLKIKPYNAKAITNFIKGIKNIKATAKWGYSEEVPDDIKWATTVLVAGIVNFSNTSQGEIKSEKMGDYSVTFKENEWKDYEIAKDIISQYTKHDV